MRSASLVGVNSHWYGVDLVNEVVMTFMITLLWSSLRRDGCPVFMVNNNSSQLKLQEK